jgi:ornithine carbamoyltransferase
MSTVTDKKRDFLKLSDFSREELFRLLDRATELKKLRRQGQAPRTLTGKTVALIFEKASTRTRLSFEAATSELGGHPMNVDTQQSQMSRGEPLQDTARVISRYAHAILLRTFSSERLHTFASASTSPVINGLSDDAHPIQLLADVQTLREHFGSVEGRLVSFVGDGSSNMARSFIEAAGIFGFKLRLVCPEAFSPPAAEVNASTTLERDPKGAGRDADVVVTDVWTSMGQEKEAAERLRAFSGYTVDAAMMQTAKRDAVVLHCLPAHRGEEITADVLEGAQSLVWDEAENRMHTAKALLEMLIL